MAAGGALVIANLRGGGEFGTDWYHAGRLDRKQNVFDDAIAVAEDLIATGVTTSDQLAVHGRSNGGLLVGALITQRPDLFAAAVPGVGVMDLLRFHRFTVGAAWKSDYGDPDDPEDFAVALAYSPLHKITEGASYPPTLVLTGDHDDRVVPLHSHKFIAALQWAQSGDAPVLTRIETATGHGAGKPTTLVAAEWADLLAFCAHHTGLDPPRRLTDRGRAELSAQPVSSMNSTSQTWPSGSAKLCPYIGPSVILSSQGLPPRARALATSSSTSSRLTADRQLITVVDGPSVADRAGGEVGEPIAGQQHHEDGRRRPRCSCTRRRRSQDSGRIRVRCRSRWPRARSATGKLMKSIRRMASLQALRGTQTEVDPTARVGSHRGWRRSEGGGSFCA